MSARRERKSAPDIEGLGDILKRTVAREAKQRRKVDERIRAKWEEIVGPEIASQTAVVSFKRHVLRVRVDSSALMAELDGIYKKELVVALAEGEGPVSVRTIEFELAGASGPR